MYFLLKVQTGCSECVRRLSILLRSYTLGLELSFNHKQSSCFRFSVSSRALILCRLLCFYLYIEIHILCRRKLEDIALFFLLSQWLERKIKLFHKQPLKNIFALGTEVRSYQRDPRESGNSPSAATLMCRHWSTIQWQSQSKEEQDNDLPFQTQLIGATEDSVSHHYY